ncbi:MAG TPA: choice-of-anchor L domain-containing protein [Bacteroidia bacterium]|nr:choice-of-anchor L domain-containing protein [Bacteroidia bacterium]
MKQKLPICIRKTSAFIAFVFMLNSSFLGFAQLVVNAGGTPTTIINNLIGAGLTVSNVQINCGANGPNAAYGTWNGTASNVGMPNGVILTTGRATNAIGPNNSGSSTGSNNITFADPQLTSISPNATNDPCILEFDVIPHCSQISLRFVFGSEEYPEYVNSIFNDAFGFFVTGPGGPNCTPNFFNNTNVAVLPNGTPMSINSVNNGNPGFGCPAVLPGPCANCAFYVNNCGCAAPPCIQYDGFTTAVIVTLNVCACQSYHWKFAIADAGDWAYDSGIFLDYLNSCGSPLVYNVTTQPAVCACNGSATVNITTGTPPYNYTWSNGQTTQTISNLCPGTYTVSVTDAISCNTAVTQTVLITGSSTPVTVTLTSQQNENCFGDTIGNAIISPSGGTPPYLYLWSTNPPQVTQNAWNLPAGNYSVIVSDTNGCADTLSVNITEPPQIVIDTTVYSHTTCNNNNGSISPSYSGGTGSFSYLWSNTQGSPTINNLAPGVYTVTVTDGINCTETASFTINPSTVPVVTTSPDITICEGQFTTLTASGAVNYSWSPPAGLSSTTGSSVNANPLNTTFYQVIGSDNFGCSDTGYINVTVNPVPMVTVTPTAIVICDGDTTPLIAAGAATYTWNPSIGLSSPTGSPVYANPPVGTYTYTVVGDLLGCLDSAQVTVAVNPMPAAAYTPVFTEGCSPVMVNFLDASTVVPPGTSYHWNFGNGNTSSQQNPSFNYIQPGNYIVTLTLTAPGGCTSVFSDTTVHVYANPVASFIIAPISSFIGRVVSFFDQTVPTPSTWNWNFGDGIGASNLQNPTYTYNDTGTFVVSLVVSTSSICSDSVTSTILIRDFEYQLWVPNIFTPNGDGINDIFYVQGIGVTKFDMTIYDRWGLEVFHSDNWLNGWNGKMRGTGAELTNGVYVYTIRAWDVGDKLNHYVGKVTIAR